MRRIPRRLALLAIIGLIAGFVVPVLSAAGGGSSVAVADDGQAFDPENIIDDALFYDGAAMTASEIQSFLDRKIGTCENGKCLNVLTTGISPRTAVYSQTTGNLICGAIQGGTMPVSELIYRVQAACGISAKVILVTLQKEQGLTTSSAPSDWNLKAAMGASCPDTSPCDPAYAGVGPQILKGTQQLKTYKAANFAKQPGVQYIGYSPNESCGGTMLNVRNYATAALYSYTPYQPNAASLAAGWGLGDGCSSYGNRNFFNYYSSWFGNPRGFEVGAPFAAYFKANSGWLIRATGPLTCGLPNGGCSQTFAGGRTFVSSTTPVVGVSADYVTTWGYYGREYGVMGYPLADRNCNDMKGSACRQEFQGGWIVASSAIGTRVVLSDFRVAWSNWGRDLGALGLPLTDQSCAGGVCEQRFEAAVMVQSPAVGVRVVPTAVGTVWSDWGRQSGTLGLPTGDPSVPGGANYTQAFQGGVVTVSGGVGRVTSASDPWFNAVLTSPWLGASSSVQSCSLGGGGCYQPFAGGWVVRSGAGSFAVPSAVLSTWASWGREYGVLGFPSGAPSADPTSGNYTQAFQGGVVTVSGGVGRVTSASDPWFNAVLTSPWLGASSSVQSCSLGGGGCYQPFAGGWVVRSGAGSFAVPSAVLSTWASWGREYGVLGFPSGAPSADPTSGNYTQAFQGGVVTVSGGVGRVTSASDPWFNAVLTSPWLGASSSVQSCSLGGGGCYQPFAGGWVVRSGAGSFAVPSAVLSTWASWGREYGVLGFPSGAPSADPTSGNYTQAFQGGVVTVSGGVGRVTSASDPWFNAVLTSPWLGASSSVQSCSLGGGGCYQPFAGGWVVRSGAGSFAVPSAVLSTWVAAGRETGRLGYPTGAPSSDPTSGTYTQAFQGGVVTVTGGVGRAG
ncbi:hypothetical protein JVX92_05510 [Microbacterium hominis]|uniref:hypothetical protein n=1 Tax=Microbacterium hominis TaxID=162426 RepID=UPI0019641A68|nr:hypothetical protein [Microbacterium hominis]QRY41708.1 hypothetical protein JVX92_05510 [Microbacterium hominis]